MLLVKSDWTGLNAAEPRLSARLNRRASIAREAGRFKALWQRTKEQDKALRGLQEGSGVDARLSRHVFVRLGQLLEEGRHGYKVRESRWGAEAAL